MKTKIIYKLIMVTGMISTINAHAQTGQPVPLPANYPVTSKVSYVNTWEPTVPITDAALVPGLPVEQARLTTAYTDGLGRPLQMVSWQQSPSKKDVVAAITYDGYGRETYKYLPFTATQLPGDTAALNSGRFKINPFAQQQAFMQAQYSAQGETFFYSQTEFEASPLSRPLQSFAPGNSWVGSRRTAAERAVSQQYSSNTAADSVRQWQVNYAAGQTYGNCTTTAVYPLGELAKTTVTDEQGHRVVEYKNKRGQVILKKVQLADAPAAGHSGWLCTYYIYDELSRLACVVPPKAVEQVIVNGWQLTAGNLMTELCFVYAYDQRSRMIAKRVPGAADVYMVYDGRDRLVMTQDGLLRTQSPTKWMVMQYDNLNRPTRTYLWTNSNTQSYHAVQAYNNINYPILTGTSELLTETYYDDYSWVAGSGTSLSSTVDATNTSNASYFITGYNTTPLYAQPLEADYMVRGMATGSKTKVLGTANQYLYSVIFYDERGRTLQVQSINSSGVKDMVTTQYDFTGKPLRLLIQHQKAGTVTTLTKMAYDHAGRLLTVKKTINSNIGGVAAASAERTVLQNSYGELGQLEKKELGIGNTGNTALENLNYDYNIRGWMLGANRDYVKGISSGNWFGFELGYDKPSNIISGETYAAPQYNGNISGSTWRAAGDGEKRKYDFSYDNVNRLTAADFNQYTINKFDKSSGIDYSVNNLTFDANGNILSMAQKGWKLGGSDFVDKLKYSYQTNSNRLINVYDTANDNSSRLGDFKFDSATKTSADYTYDVNGNMVVDNNKNINTITYNYLNLPQIITVTNKGSIEYVYDAAGNKQKKIIHETGKPDKTIEYMAGFVYEDNVVQLTGHEEGRIRYVKQYYINGDSAMTWQYDYFLKDHLGNIRTVLTEQTDTAKYMATFETAARPKETALFTRIAETAYPIASIISPTYPADTTTSPNTYTSKLDGIANQFGATLALKVMAGDKVDMGVKAWVPYAANAPNTSNIQPVQLLSGLIAALTNGSAGLSGGKVTPAELQGGNSPMLGGINSFLGSQSEPPAGWPKAYLNWILFDEQFKYVPEGSGFIQAEYYSDRRLQTLATSGLPVVKSGYLFVYLSYQAKMADGEKPVFFDNLVVQHYTGPLTEENVYYPFGLPMAGLSSKAIGRVENKYKYNGKEEQRKEWSDGSGLEEYDFGARFYDCQIGRWNTIDPLTEKAVGITPYNFTGNNPINLIDPDGMEVQEVNGRIEVTGDDIAIALEQAKINLGIAYSNSNETDEGSDVEGEVKGLAEKGDYAGATRKIIASYHDINDGLVEGKDYNISNNYTYIDGGKYAAFETRPVPYDAPLEKLSPIPTIYINPTGSFKKYLSKQLSYGGLVRSVYHETIHVRLYLGKMPAFPFKMSSGGENVFFHEVIAHYYHLSNNVLPKQNNHENSFYANNGKQMYNWIKQPINIEWRDKYLKHMNEYFKTFPEFKPKKK